MISALSYALDITEGQPKGHAARSCMLGMRIAQDLRLDEAQSSALFYALLMKDLGCSSNAGKMCYLFGADDRELKARVKTVNWTNLAASTRYIARNVATGGSWVNKFRHFARVAIAGQKEARALVELRCDRGAKIARELEFPQLTAEAIRSLDEHWDGAGHPSGLRGAEIPLLARILGIAQTVEVFITQHGTAAAMQMVHDRSGTWFDPTLCNIVLNLEADESFWATFHHADPSSAVARFDPQETSVDADQRRLDRIAEAFSQVIDAKSPWTYRHSEGVAKLSSGIALVLGYPVQSIRSLRRAALVHDIGKLGISNLILDKPAKLTDAEYAEMKRHTFYTHEILSRVDGFRDLADLAAAHHEQLDGRGYHRGLIADQLSQPARILHVADVFEALTAKRPYRKDLTDEEVSTIMEKKLGWAICPIVYDALKTYVNTVGYSPISIAA